MQTRHKIILVLSAFLLAGGFVHLDSKFQILDSFSVLAQTFTGPDCAAGQCQGAISVDTSNNLAIGTTTVLSDTRLFIQGGNSTSTAFAIQLKNLEGRPMFVVRNDGRTVIGPYPIGAPPSIGNSASTLLVRGLIETVDSVDPNRGGGIRFPDGTTQTTAFLGSTTQTMSAANVSFGAFGSNTGGGNYSFPANLSIGTTTSPAVQTPLFIAAQAPRIGLYDHDLPMSVSNPAWIVRANGAGTFNIQSTADYSAFTDRIVVDTSGNVSIGTSTPAGLLHLYGSPYIRLQQSAGTRDAWDIGIEAATQRVRLINNTSGYGEVMSILRTGNIGIATSTPGNWLLDINTATTNGFRISNSGGAGLEITANGSLTNRILGYNRKTSTYQPIYFATDVSEDTLYLDTAGRVGIGTTTPTALLTITSDGTVKNDYISLVDTAASGKRFTLYNRFNGVAGTFGIYDSTAGVGRLVIDTNGNVGIGTTTPGYALAVQGTIYSSTGGFRFPDGTTQTTAAAGGTTSAANVSAGTFGANTGNGNFSFPAHLGISNTNTLRINGVADANWTFGTDASYNINVRGFGSANRAFQVVDDSTGSDVTKFSVNLVGGKVGIGTTTVSTAPYALTIDAGASSGITIKSTAALSLELRGPSRTWGVTNNVAGTGYFSIYDGTSAANRLTIDTAGRAGIGTATPSAAAGLTIDHANGGLYVARTATWIDYNATGGNYFGGVTYFRGVSGSPVNAVIDGEGTANTYFAVAGGRVGIGTTTPSLKLEVVGGRAWVRNAEQYAIGVSYSGTSGNYWIGSSNPGNGNADMIFSNTNGTETVRFTHAGYVGIGTSTPAFPLTVYLANASNYVDVRGTNGAYDIANRWTDGTNQVYAGNMRGSTGLVGAFTVWTGGAARMNVLSTGNVLIGTTTQSALLTVGTSTSGLVASFGNGSGKINVGTIDPVYTIGGEKFATYLPGMTGQKEETTGNIQCQISNGQCRQVIDFKDLVKGSDLWLFGKASNLVKDKANFEAMTVMLTPSFDGRVWYRKNVAERTVTIFAKVDSRFQIPDSDPLEISYRLTSPRFDSAQWTNISHDNDEGFNLDKLIK